MKSKLSGAMALCGICLLAPAAGAAPDFAAQTDVLRITTAESLPKNPASGPAGCGGLAEPPATAAAARVTAAGWTVSAEVTRAGLTFVSFLGSATPGTSGTCEIQDGNIGIFEGETLQALIYAPKGSARSIGSLAAQEGNLIRIYDGDLISQPLADLQIPAENLVLLQNVAPRDTLCKGAVSVPVLYGLPAHLARRILLAESWQPAPLSEVSTDGTARDLQADYPEVVDCSGTGLGYCSWEYQRAGGFGLSLTTAGEAAEGSSPMVVGQATRCPG